jgi:hypothetical protein
MFELFLNPWYAIAGGALISSPIIIHLINRMRFRRVRWAAMEFLLKSQKRNRRRLIIEQLVLLALRCLLCILAGLLIARFLGFSALGFFQPQNTTHIVVLDDTLSMNDQFKGGENVETKTAFDAAKGLIREIAKSASRAGSAQQLKIIRLSESGTVIFNERLNDQTLRDLAGRLEEEKCTQLHVAPLEGIKAAQALFEESKQDQRLLHFVSDFRGNDWSGPEASAVNTEVEAMARAGVKIFMVDAAHPVRGEARTTPTHHDNLAIIELRPETRIAAEGMPVQFTVTIRNYSNVEYKGVFLSIKVDGFQRLEASVPILSIKPNGDTKQTFMVGFVRPGFSQITASLDQFEDGLQGDNTRFAVMEMRKQVPVLVIDGDPAIGLKPGGDTYHLQTVFTAAKGYQIVSRGVGELERPTLEQYPCIYLCNVAQLSDKAVKNLEEYVAGGGSVAFFLGEKVRSEFYNKTLYKDGKGLFPAPLAEKATEPLPETERFTRLFDQQMKIYLRGEKYEKPGVSDKEPLEDFPVFGQIYSYRNIFKFLLIDRYFPVPRQKWSPEQGKVEELVTLPNDRPLEGFVGEAQRLMRLLPTDEPRYEKYRPGLEEHQRAIRSALSGKFLYELTNAWEQLLTDPGTTQKEGEGAAKAEEKKRPSMVEFWQQPELKNLRAEFAKFLELVKYGDPLVIASKFGKGRVVAWMTSAGKSWNEWAGGNPASVTYPVVMLELHKYLTSVVGDNEQMLGAPINLELDPARYDPKMHVFFQPEITDAPPPGKPPSNLRDLGEQQGQVTNGRLQLTFNGTREPGLYLVDLFPRTEQNAEAPPEHRAYVYNVDNIESDLKRTPREDLERHAKIAYPGSPPDVAQRQSDLSESPWFYVVILLVLVAEQAMAVRLSFHLHGHDAPLPMPAPRTRTAAA